MVIDISISYIIMVMLIELLCVYYLIFEKRLSFDFDFCEEEKKNSVEIVY